MVKKNGALGTVAIQILEYFVNCINSKTGQLDPCINTIMKKIGRSRDAIYRALNNLKNHGFLNWIRRYIPTGKKYPSLEQTSNAYQLNLPKEAEALINFTPLPDDIKSSIEEKIFQQQKYEKQSVNIPEMWGIESQSLHGALLSLFENIKSKNSRHNCESVIRTE